MAAKHRPNADKRLPDNVQHHHRDVLPDLPPRETVPVHQREPNPAPKTAPPGWCGSYNQCSGCGDFLGAATRCEKCSPLPKMMA